MRMMKKRRETEEGDEIITALRITQWHEPPPQHGIRLHATSIIPRRMNDTHVLYFFCTQRAPGR